MLLAHIVGARPNFMKLAPVHRALAQAAGIEQLVVHTGQHYDINMSDIFFQQLKIAVPDVNLQVGSGSHAKQTAEIMTRFEEVVSGCRPDLVLVYGDVNSTVAAALVCAKLRIPVAHVEAGLRSFDRSMPEEINRLVTDQLADLLFTPSEDGDRNLGREGISPEKIHLVGNVMIDTLISMLPASKSFLPENLPPRFALVTLHRPSNVDDLPWLKRMLRALEELSVGSLPTKRVSVHDNIAENVTGPILKMHIGQVSKCTASGNACRLSDISIVHNSIVSTNPIPPLPSGAPLATMDFIYSEARSDSPQANAGYNLTIKDNIFPCSAYCIVNDSSISTSENCKQPTQGCGFAKALNAYFAASGAGTTGWVFTKNVITNLVAAGWGESDLPAHNSDNAAADNFTRNLPKTMANVGFTNWNNGNAGNYTLLNTAAYHSRGDDGADAGANVGKVINCTNGVVAGTPAACRQ